MTKVIPHQKPKREPKPKRYAVEYFSEDRWLEKQDFRLLRNAKYWARYWDEYRPEFKWRVVDHAS